MEVAFKKKKELFELALEALTDLKNSGYNNDDLENNVVISCLMVFMKNEQRDKTPHEVLLEASKRGEIAKQAINIQDLADKHGFDFNK
jgi:hypothetical protein